MEPYKHVIQEAKSTQPSVVTEKRWTCKEKKQFFDEI